MVKRRNPLIVSLIVFVGVVGAVILAFYYWHNSHYFVRAQNASLVVPLEPIRAPRAIDLTTIRTKVNDRVGRGSTLATGTAYVHGKKVTKTIIAPQSGHVLTFYPVNGASLAANQVLGYIGQLKSAYVRADIPESRTQHIKIGQAAKVYFAAYPGHSYQGIVQAIGKATIPFFSPVPEQLGAAFAKQTVFVPVHIQLLQKHLRIWPGMTATVQITIR